MLIKSFFYAARFSLFLKQVLFFIFSLNSYQIKIETNIEVKKNALKWVLNIEKRKSFKMS